ncbi:MAG: hypothetical protein IPL49_01615 [Saprospirales bacterium]|nr:hypothetical protein [Saprospirales bacterium]MBK8489617.1 hypothetical protein [Saprospirales bacterium]
MTLQDFFNWLSMHPGWLLFFFLLIPLSALLAGWIGKGEGHLSPWKYFYATLIYMVCIPGLFAVFLNIYLFLFERQSIMETNIYTQLLPIFSMVASVFLVRKNVDLDLVPGFGKLSGLFVMISAILITLFFIDRTRLFAFTFVPFQYVLLLFAAMLLLARWGWKRFI